MRYQQAAVHTAYALRELVETVVPHLRLFEEASLQPRVSRVIEMTDNLLRNMYPERVIGSTLQGIPVREPSIKINPPSANNSILPGRDTETSPPALQIPTSSAVASSEIDVKPVMASSYTDPHVKSEHEDPPLSRRPSLSTSVHPVDGKSEKTMLAPNPEQPLPMDSMHDTAAGPSSAVPSPAPTKPQPKRVRKPEMSKLLARDLDWCKSMMASAAHAQLPQVPATSVEPVSTPMDIHAASLTSCGQVGQAISVEREVPPEMKQKAGASSSPRHDGVTTAIGVESNSLPLPSPPPGLALPPVPAPASGSLQAPSEDSGVLTRTIAAHGPLLSPPPQPACSPEDMTLTENSKGDLPPSAATDGRPFPSSPVHSPPLKQLNDTSDMQPKCITVPPTATVNSTPPLPSLPTTGLPLSDQSPAGIEHSTSPLVTENDEHSLLSPPREPLPPQHAIVTLDNTCPSTLPSPTGEFLRPGESPLDEDLSKETLPPERVIMYSTKGDTLPRTHDVSFTISEEVHSNVSRWVNRKTSSTDLSSSYCISVACYRLCDLGAAAEQSLDERNLSIPGATAHIPCSWPASTHLLLSLKRGEKNWTLPLSPPFKATPDQFMDISSFVRAGENTLQIIQYGDLSDHALVIHAHHPTSAQLAELKKMQVADQKWKSFLDSICGSLELGPINAREVPVR
ncbi:hypothetical protein EDD16DRAFT_427180 [Pisolithus croceorrhizus]|nr:hypothetical protein EDD16DRAFT_427180 [Pisolithus croceorrhizus]